MNNESNNKYYSIEIVGNDVIMWYKVEDENGNKQNKRENYTIGEDGKLEVAQVGEPRRLTDDMTRLDIRLMEETDKAGVATSQMLQVVDTMKATLKVKEKQEKSNDI